MIQSSPGLEAHSFVLEAGEGIEPPMATFAELCITTLLPRHESEQLLWVGTFNSSSNIFLRTTERHSTPCAVLPNAFIPARNGLHVILVVDF
jgi:hypothetical protein